MLTILRWIFNRLFRATWHSINGLLHLTLTEQAFMLEVIAFGMLVPIAIIFEHDNVRRALMIGALLLVLLVEALNTAIETTIDRISTEHHPLSKKAKDIGSAAVLIAILNAMMVWVFVLTES